MNDFFQNQPTAEFDDLPDSFSDSSGTFLTDKLAASPAGEKFVVFFLNEKPFAVAARRIAEVARPLAVAPLPNAPEWLAGIANLRGEIISVINLPKMLKSENSTSSGKTKFVILHTSESDASIAFHADRLGEIVFINDREIESAERDAPYIFGSAPYEKQILQVIDVEKLLSSLTFN